MDSAIPRLSPPRPARTIITLSCRLLWKEKFLGTGSGNLTELEEAINH